MGSLLNFEDFKNFFIDIEAVFSKKLVLFVSAYCLSCLLRFYQFLIFNTSLGLLLSGLQTVGCGPFLSRIVLAMKSLLSPLFFLLLPFDLFFKGEAGVLEVFFHLRYQERETPLIIAPISFTFLLALLPVSLLMWDLTIFDRVDVSKVVYKAQKLTNSSQFNLFKTYQSNLFHFSSFSSLGDGRFIVYPSFQMEQKEKFISFYPKLQIFDDQRKKTAHFEIIEKNLKLNEMLKESFHSDLWLSMKFRHLQQYIDSEKSLDDIAKKQLQKLIMMAMELNKTNLYAKIKTYGPYPYGVMLLRKRLLDVFQMGEHVKFDLVHYGDSKFVRVVKKYVMSEYEDSILLPIAALKVPLYRLRWPLEGEKALGKKEFESSLFASSKWKFEKSDQFQFPNNIAEMNPFFILDYFKDKKLKENKRVLFEGYVYSYFRDVAKDALDRGDDILRDQLYSTLEMIGEIVRLRNRKDEYYSREFMNKLKNLLQALAKEDRNYFNI